MTLSISDLTAGQSTTTDGNFTVTGTGVFDNLITAAQAHLNAQYNLNRITGTEYSTVYLGIVQAVLTASINYTLGMEKANAEVSLLTQKEITEFAQTEQTTKVAPDTGSVIGRANNLSTEQAKGFQWNADQKYLKTLLDAWAVNISVANVAATGVDAIKETGVGNINTQISNAEPT